MFTYLYIYMLYIHLYILYYTYHIHNLSHIIHNTFTYWYTFHISLVSNGLQTFKVHTICCYKQFKSSFSNFLWSCISFVKSRPDIKHFADPFGYQFHQFCFTLVKYCRRFIATTPSMYKQYMLNNDRIQSLCNLSDTHQLLNLFLLFLLAFMKISPMSLFQKRKCSINIPVSSANTVTLFFFTYEV